MLPTPHHSDQGWILDVPPEMARAMGVAEGSRMVLRPKDGGADVEVLPPPTPELKAAARRLYDKYKDAFSEMKRRGD